MKNDTQEHLFSYKKMNLELFLGDKYKLNN